MNYQESYRVIGPDDMIEAIRGMDRATLDDMSAAINRRYKALQVQAEADMLSLLIPGGKVKFLDSTTPKKFAGLEGRFVGMKGRRFEIDCGPGWGKIRAPASTIRRVL